VHWTELQIGHDFEKSRSLELIEGENSYPVACHRNEPRDVVREDAKIIRKVRLHPTWRTGVRRSP
jgi:hypothetical protein